MAELLRELSLGANGSCLQFCPAPAAQDVLALGTYTLDETSQTRSGDLRAYQVSLKTDDTARSAAAVELTPTRACAGAFDVTWTAPAVLNLAMADGQSLSCEWNGSELCSPVSERHFEGALCTCVSIRQDRLCTATSSSDGQLRLIRTVDHSPSRRSKLS